MYKDLVIYETGDGGDLNLVNNDLELTHTLFYQVYMALFGGNIEQDTDSKIEGLEQRHDWWGNAMLPIENQFNSKTERELRNIIISGSSLQNLESIVKKDLAYFRPYGDISVQVSMIDYNKIEIGIIIIEPSGAERKMKFLWNGVGSEMIQDEELGTRPVYSSTWILTGGYWDDRGTWYDNELWNDGV